MRELFLTTTDKNVQEDLFSKLFDLLKNGNFFEDFRLKNIMLCKWVKNNEYHIAISMADCVPATFNISAYKAAGDQAEQPTSVVNSEIFSEPLNVPRLVKISVEWTKDIVNSYKIISTNFDDIKHMAHESVSADEIAKKYNIKWSEEDSEWIKKRNEM